MCWPSGTDEERRKRRERYVWRGPLRRPGPGLIRGFFTAGHAVHAGCAERAGEAMKLPEEPEESGRTHKATKQKDKRGQEWEVRRSKDKQVIPGPQHARCHSQQKEQDEEELTNRGSCRATQDTQMRALRYLHLWPHTWSLLVTRQNKRCEKSTSEERRARPFRRVHTREYATHMS